MSLCSGTGGNPLDVAKIPPQFIVLPFGHLCRTVFSKNRKILKVGEKTLKIFNKAYTYQNYFFSTVAFKTVFKKEIYSWLLGQLSCH